jgi:hypothetical protein
VADEFISHLKKTIENFDRMPSNPNSSCATLNVGYSEGLELQKSLVAGASETTIRSFSSTRTSDFGVKAGETGSRVATPSAWPNWASRHGSRREAM